MITPEQKEFVNRYLPRGGRKKIALLMNFHPIYVLQVLRGVRNNQAVIDLAVKMAEDSKLKEEKIQEFIKTI